MKAAPFAYIRPTSVAEAVAALAEHEGMARVLAGGQSLVPMLNMRLMRPSAVVDVNRIPGLDAIAVDPSGGSIGALTRYSAIEASAEIAAHLPLLTAVTRHIGDRQVRNRGTLGGSLAQADPVGEMPLACLALGASVIVESMSGTREVPVSELLLGPYWTSLEPDELLVEVRFPNTPSLFAFSEVTRRHNDFAVLAVAVTATRTGETFADVRLAASGVEATAILADAAGAALEGTSLTDLAIADAVEALVEAADPSDDVRATAEYRVHLLRVHARRALERLRDGGDRV